MIERVAKLLNRCGGRASVMPPTELYNEGWLLRVALDWFGTDGPSDSQFSFSSGAVWYSEGRLASRFLARSRSDKKAEGFTHADGTIGHFLVSPGERSEIVPTADATQLVVIEAKLGSPLSSGTTSASLRRAASTCPQHDSRLDTGSAPQSTGDEPARRTALSVEYGMPDQALTDAVDHRQLLL